MIPLYDSPMPYGKLNLSRTERALFVDYRNILEGKERQIMVEERKHRRTIAQNAYLWGVVYQRIADYSGHEPEDIHEFCTDKLLGNTEICMHGEYRPVPRCSHDVAADRFFEEDMDPLCVWAAQELHMTISGPHHVSP
jgi:hypothetical protein